MFLPEYTNNVLVHCMQRSSHRQQEVCKKKDLKQKMDRKLLHCDKPSVSPSTDS